MNDKYVIEFKKRNIALLGNWDVCKFFFLQFHSLLRIQYIFTTNMDDMNTVKMKEILGKQLEIKCIPLKESIIQENNLLLILCVEHECRKPYDDLLFYKGFEWGEDYIDDLFVIQYYRRVNRIELKDRNIWIFGAGNNGRDFYEKYKTIYHICGFISNFEEEKECFGLPVIRTKDIPINKNFFIVICSDSDVLMSRQLEEMGYKGGRDYGFECTLPKKLFVAIGTCQIVYTAGMLCRNICFGRQYSPCIYFDNIFEPSSDSDNRRMKGYGEFCDVVFYNIAGIGTTWQRNYESLIHSFYKNAKKLFMSFYSFNGQLMQAVEGVNPYTLKTIKGNAGFFWWKGDKEINHMIEDGWKEEEILKTISKNNYWLQSNIIDNFERELKKVEVWDRFSSFPIKPFIEENYRNELIFIDGIHFSSCLGIYLANEIAKCLQIEKINEEEFINEMDGEQRSVMPVYPCVKKALGMDMPDRYKFYNVEKNIIEYLTFDEYVKKYIQYVSAVQNMYEKIGTYYR